MVTNVNKWQLLATLVTNGDFFLIFASFGNTWQLMANFCHFQCQSVAVSDSQWECAVVCNSQWQFSGSQGSLWQSVAVYGNLWQSMAVNWQSLLICISLSAAGAKANCALPTILCQPSLESLAFLEILRLLKSEDIITIVRSHVGSATPPSVMVLFFY